MKKIEKLLVTALLTTTLSTSSLSFASEHLEGTPFDPSTVTEKTFEKKNIDEVRSINKQFNEVRNDPLVGAEGKMVDRRDNIKNQLEAAAHVLNIKPGTAALNALANAAVLSELKHNESAIPQQAAVVATAVENLNPSEAADSSFASATLSDSALPTANNSEPVVISEAISAAAQQTAADAAIAVETAAAAAKVAAEAAIAADTARQAAEAELAKAKNEGTKKAAEAAIALSEAKQIEAAEAAEAAKVADKTRKIAESEAVETAKAVDEATKKAAAEAADTARVVTELVNSIRALETKTPEEVAADAEAKYKEDEQRVAYLERILVEKHRRDTGDASPALFEASQSTDQLLDDALEAGYELVDEPYETRNQSLHRKAQDLMKLSITGYSDSIKTERAQIKIERDQARALFAEKLMSTAADRASTSIALRNISAVETVLTAMMEDTKLAIETRNRATETKEAITKEKEKLIREGGIQNVNTYLHSFDENNAKAKSLSSGAKLQPEVLIVPPARKPDLSKDKVKFEESYPHLAKIIEARNLATSISASQQLTPEAKLENLRMVSTSSIADLRRGITNSGTRSGIRESLSRFDVATSALLGKQ